MSRTVHHVPYVHRQPGVLGWHVTGLGRVQDRYPVCGWPHPHSAGACPGRRGPRISAYSWHTLRDLRYAAGPVDPGRRPMPREHTHRFAAYVHGRAENLRSLREHARHATAADRAATRTALTMARRAANSGGDVDLVLQVARRSASWSLDRDW
jgi:hypothetical protein